MVVASGIPIYVANSDPVNCNPADVGGTIRAQLLRLERGVFAYICDDPRPRLGPVLHGAEGVVSRVCFSFPLSVNQRGPRLLDHYNVCLNTPGSVKRGVVVRARSGAYVDLDQ